MARQSVPPTVTDKEVQALLGRYACSWSLDQVEDYLAVVPNEDALEKFVKLHGLPIKVGG